VTKNSHSFEKSAGPLNLAFSLSQKTGRVRMPDEGEKYLIFQPLYHMDQTKLGNALFSSPQEFLHSFSRRIEWVESITIHAPDNTGKENLSLLEKSQEAYLEFLKSFLTATVFNAAEFSVRPGEKIEIVPFDSGAREGGEDWTYLGDTMIGNIRMKNIWELIADVTKNNVPGDYMETGVWRGGASVFARAVLNVLGQTRRTSYVCDSFAGLPPGDRFLDAGDAGWNLMSFYLAIPEEIVATNFKRTGLLDSNVVFAKGFFNETMPVLRKHIKKVAVLRLDGDMYESTVDVLYHFYDKLSIGGYVIMDDWYGFPAKTAAEDFFRAHDIYPEIFPVDKIAAYWKKTVDVNIQYWRYEQNKF